MWYNKIIMDDKALQEYIQKRDVGGMWLFYGPERYALRTFVKKCLTLPGEAMREMNTARLENAGEAEIRAAADALPFFDDLRVVVCEKTDADTVAAIAEHPERVPETTMLIFVSHGKLRADSAMLKPFKKLGRDVLFDTRTPDSARRFIDNMARRYGTKFNDGAATLLIERRGTDLAQLESDVGMLCCVHEDGAPVTADDIKRYIPEKTENKSWDLLGLFLKKDFAGGLRMYEKMLQDDPKGDFMILGYMEKRIAQMLEVQALLRQRKQEKEIGEITGVKGGSLYHLLDDSKKADPQMLRRALEALAQTDYYIKSGTRPMRDALFTALVEAFLPPDGKNQGAAGTAGGRR